jgi:hypothetical protein
MGSTSVTNAVATEVDMMVLVADDTMMTMMVQVADVMVTMMAQAADVVMMTTAQVPSTAEHNTVAPSMEVLSMAEPNMEVLR